MRRKMTAAVLAAVLMLSGCSAGAQTEAEERRDGAPLELTIWHYYNGSQQNAFDRLVDEYNETQGKEKGIFVEGHSKGNVSELEDAVRASARKDVGSEEMPDIFSSYADTAFELEKSGRLADLTPYFTEEELGAYIDSYIEEGRIGINNELKIFPVAKSTEIFMVNRTIWDEFSAAAGITEEELRTKEGVVRTAEAYYNWTDAKTPDIPNDGLAFYGRDALANLFIIGSMQLGTELFKVENQKVTLQIDRDVFKRIWDCYYVPYVKGYYGAYGRFRSDDVKIGELAAYTGSTTSAGYFPDEVEIGDTITPIDCLVLPVPAFEGGEPYIVQQGAGMVVTKSTPEKEAAACDFLKWFTQVENNLKFSCSSSYLPVLKEACSTEHLDAALKEVELNMPEKEYSTMEIAFEMIRENKLYTNKAFDGGSAARKVLEYDLSDKAAADREQVKQRLAAGVSLDEAVSDYISEEAFDAWFEEVSLKLQQSIEDSAAAQ